MFDLLLHLLDIVLHVDKYLSQFVNEFGIFTYAILFFIIFFETGLVVTPFLPGDSLLFAAGAISAISDLSVFIMIPLLIIAAIIGDSLNYSIGKYLGPKIFSKEKSFFFNKNHLDKTQKFYERHGGKTILIARFVPIVRTFAPFVAGIGKMRYSYFLMYNVGGAILWVTLFVLAGFWFGNMPIVKENFSLVIMMIIVISLLPMLFEFLRAKYFSPNQE